MDGAVVAFDIFGVPVAVGTNGAAVIDAHVVGFVGPLWVDAVSVLDEVRSNGLVPGRIQGLVVPSVPFWGQSCENPFCLDMLHV